MGGFGPKLKYFFTKMVVFIRKTTKTQIEVVLLHSKTVYLNQYMTLNSTEHRLKSTKYPKIDNEHCK